METLLITGSTRGIGYCIASYLANRDYLVIIHGSQESSLVTAKDALSFKPNVRYVAHDLTKDPTTLIDRCLELEGVSKIDILVNNCGIAKHNDKTMETHNLNFRVPYELTRYIAMKGCKKIINISSGGAVLYHSDLFLCHQF